MQRLLLGAALLALATPVAAGAPTTIAAAKVYAPGAAQRTVAVVRPEAGSALADEALATGLREAGLTVVAADAKPQLLVSYITRVDGLQGVFANGAHAGTSIVPASSVVDNYTRLATVIAWDARTPRPTKDSVAWLTQLRSEGLSSERRQFLPAMLRAGAAGYGRSIEGPRRPMRG